VIHELLHGLGFISLWNVNLQDIVSTSPALRKNPTYMNLLTPPPQLNADNAKAATNGEASNLVKGFIPPVIFDKFIYDSRTNTPLSTFYDTFQEYCVEGDISSWTSQFLRMTNYVKLSNLLYERAVTPGSLYLNLPATNGGSLRGILHTGPFEGQFQAGSSITHLDQDIYAGKDDFLLRPVVTHGVTLDAEIQSGKSLFGPVTVAVFREMGYTLKNETSTNRAEDSKLQETAISCRTKDIEPKIYASLEATRLETPPTYDSKTFSSSTTLPLYTLPVYLMAVSLTVFLLL
jgi:hypothetical protein